MQENLTQTQASIVPQTPPDTSPDQPQKAKKHFVLIFVHVTAIAIIGFLVYQNMQLKKEISQYQPTPIASTVPTTQSTTDSAVNWKTYVIPSEKLTIKYPSDWILTTVEDQFRTILTSPNNFILVFTTDMDGLGGGCDSDCQKYNITNVVLDTLNFYKVPLYVVVNGMKEDSSFGKAYIGFNVIPDKTCLSNICYGFNGKNSSGTTGISGGYANESTGSSVYMPVDEFVTSTDVKVALSILEKLSY